jgi:predicted aldo/keto reductase-like oxidoreductase
MYNDFLRLESDKILTNYGLFTKPEERANQCTKCGLCNQYCPQNIDIPVELAALQKEIDRVKADQK